MDSTHKLIEYIVKVSKQAVTVNDKILLEKPISKVTLNPNFFIKDDCKMCGRCCVNENQAFTKADMSRLTSATKEDYDIWGLNYDDNQLLLEGITEQQIEINGNLITFYSFPKDTPKLANRLSYPDRPNLQRCHWLFNKEDTHRCRIHPVRSITCRLPHLRFFHNSSTNRTGMGVGTYGRNWALGCPAEFGEVDEESTLSRLGDLKLLDQAANDMKIETYLPEVINYLETGGRQPKEFTMEKRRKLF